MPEPFDVELGGGARQLMGDGPVHQAEAEGVLVSLPSDKVSSKAYQWLTIVASRRAIVLSASRSKFSPHVQQ